MKNTLVISLVVVVGLAGLLLWSAEGNQAPSPLPDIASSNDLGKDYYTLVYDISGLLAEVPERRADGEQDIEEQYATLAKRIGELITNIAPEDSWQKGGGQGTLTVWGARLVISQTAETHAKIRNMFNQTWQTGHISMQQQVAMDRADQALRAARQQGDARLEELCSQGVILIRERKYKLALDLYRQVLTIDAKNTSARELSIWLQETIRSFEEKPTFGPVIERVLTHDVRLQTTYLDLDTGDYVGPEDGSTSQMGRMASVDLYYGPVGGSEEIKLATSNLQLQPLSQTGWDTDPERVRQAMMVASPYSLQPSDKRTLAFKTRKSGMGILQVVGFTEKPKGVRIRYKMLQAAKKPRFGIYLIKKPPTEHGVEQIPLEELVLQDVPVITEADIVLYDWDIHLLQLKPGVADRLQNQTDGRLTAWFAWFVVVADGERCYLGAFSTVYFSYLPRTPVVFIDTLFTSDERFMEYMMWIRPTTLFAARASKDPRSDPRIGKVLRELGKLRNPVVVTLPPEEWDKPLDGVQIRLRSEKAVWKAGETPALLFEFNNQTPREVFVPDGQRSVSLEINGRKYSYVKPGSLSGEGVHVILRPEQTSLVRITLDGAWHRPERFEPLQLLPGKYLIKAMVSRHAQPLFTSNPVEIEIQPPTPPTANSQNNPLLAEELEELAEKHLLARLKADKFMLEHKYGLARYHVRQAQKTLASQRDNLSKNVFTLLDTLDQEKLLAIDQKELIFLRQRLASQRASSTKPPLKTPQPVQIALHPPPKGLRKGLPSVRYGEVPLAEVIDDLRNKSGADIIVNWQSLNNLDIDKTTTVSLNLRNVTSARVLKAILATLSTPQAKVSYIIHEGTVTIASSEHLDSIVITRVYNFAHLMRGRTQTRTSSTNRLTATDSFRNDEIEIAYIIELVKNAVPAESWRDAGGPGTVSFFDTQLIVTQIIFYHERIARLLFQIIS